MSVIKHPKETTTTLFNSSQGTTIWIFFQKKYSVKSRILPKNPRRDPLSQLTFFTNRKLQKVRGSTL